jgi:hypothetical protein
MLCIVNKVIPANAGIQALLPGIIEQLRQHPDNSLQPGGYGYSPELSTMSAMGPREFVPLSTRWA